MRKILFLAFTASMLVSSCIREEAPNLEADIEQATLPEGGKILKDNPIIGNNSVTFNLKTFKGDFLYAPNFELSKGATIIPANGSMLDFNEPKTYTVTSENGQWTKEYTVSFVIDDNTAIQHYSFEKAETIHTTSPEGHFHLLFEQLNNQKRYDWATANEGYNTLAKTLLKKGEEFTPAVYPSAQTPDGYKGNGIKLQTKSTGFLGSLFGSPLAAGNLFLGSFKQTFPVVKSTKFGMDYNFKTAPKAVTGYFKYTAGETLTKTKKNTQLTRDTWDAYAILFEKGEKDNFLPGDHAFKDPRIVSVARLKPEQRIETNEWTKFEILFEDAERKKFNPEKEYMFTIVLTSSIEGDVFNGAVGSTLYIDEIEIITK
ncbi:PCMD domain-containing protein [Capnocytophaga sp.]|uniref:PCMD domain-containing protein n=1 Tax=Capnocytophaga sp. TaxID=44737 RepID=UPI0026DC48A3|nr:PCMD domain-containing protein [Capnocytophaga sp.]MDO5105516.1 PCMD domain-containing protein [Capnocytophaga sp.]